MPSRKQRRRRAKERRHDYEFVYIDEQGLEIEVDPDGLEAAAPGRNGKREPRREPQKGKGKNDRPVRTVQPPSWGRVGRRALIFFPLIFIAFSLLSKNQAFGSRLVVAAVYTLFFIPFMYLMDRTLYRAYLKRTGQLPPSQRSRGRR